MVLGLLAEAVVESRANVRRRGIGCPEAKGRVLEMLGAVPEGLSKAELVRRTGASAPTMQRALKALEEEHAIERDRRANVWKLVDQTFSVPLESPSPADLEAVLIAEALLAPIADETMRARLARLAEQLDERIRRARPKATQPKRAMAPTAVTATVTSATKSDPVVLDRVLRAARREVVEILYCSPWKDIRERRTIEPWQVRIHDGAPYLRAWDRAADEPRTFRLAHIEQITPRHGEKPRARIPRQAALWGDGDPACGIDHDRPGTATLRVRGAVARWLGAITWHPDQQDRWIVEGDLLERRVPYTSCREMARRVLSVLDGVEDIRPAELRQQVEANIRQYEGQSQKRAKPARRHDQSKITGVG